MSFVCSWLWPHPHISKPTDQRTVLLTKSCLKCHKSMESLQGERSIFYTRFCKKADKWPTLCWPGLFWSQLQQLMHCHPEEWQCTPCTDQGFSTVTQPSLLQVHAHWLLCSVLHVQSNIWSCTLQELFTLTVWYTTRSSENKAQINMHVPARVRVVFIGSSCIVYHIL